MTEPLYAWIPLCSISSCGRWPATQFPRNPICCYLQISTSNPSLIILLHLSPVICCMSVALNILFVSEGSTWIHPLDFSTHALWLSRLSELQEGEWQVGGLLEMGPCFLHQMQPWENDQGISRSSNLRKPMAHPRQTLDLSSTKGAVFNALNKGHHYEAAKVIKYVKPFNLPKI